jgi:hypothetical protein
MERATREGFMLQLSGFVIWLITLVGISVLAGISRDIALRQAVAACLVAYVLTLILEHHSLNGSGINIGIFIVDSTLAIVFSYIAILNKTYWSIAAFGFQLAALALHVAYFFAPEFSRPGYFVALSATSYLVVGSILAGGIASLRNQQ